MTLVLRPVTSNHHFHSTLRTCLPEAGAPIPSPASTVQNPRGSC